MMKCEIIRDLIPLYLDKVCSEDSRKLVEEHLAECSECRKYMKELETELEAVKQKKAEYHGCYIISRIGTFDIYLPFAQYYSRYDQ